MLPTSVYGRAPLNPLSDFASIAQWHDTFYVDGSTLPAAFTPKVYASNYDAGAGVAAQFSAVLLIQRIPSAV